MKIEETYWFQKLKQYDHIMIFGAKSNAQLTYESVKQIHLEIEGFVVSERLDNPFWLEGKTVKVFEEIEKELKQTALVIISQIYENNDSMRRLLLQAGFKNIIPSMWQMTLATTEKLQQYRQSVLGPMQMSQQVLEDFSQVSSDPVNLCIYVVTSHVNQHKNKQCYRSNYIKYIQAGAKCTDIKVCDFTDDNGENISDLNPYYCELTAGYWVFKNDHIHDYVGLYHYSRGLAVTDGQLEDMTRKGIDVVLPVPLVWRYEMIVKCFLYADIILKAISKISPEYIVSAKKFFSEKLFFIGNILLAKRRIYVEYYDWMFRVFRECEKIKKEDRKQIEPRIWGYYGEILTSIYFIHNKKNYQIVFSPMSYLY